MGIWENLTNWKSRIRFTRKEVVKNTENIENNIVDIDNALVRLDTLEEDTGGGVDLTAIETDIIPIDNGIKKLGKAYTNEFSTIYGRRIQADNLMYLGVTTNYDVMRIYGTSVNFSEKIQPNGDLSEDIGAVSMRWGSGYINTVKSYTTYTDFLRSNSLTEIYLSSTMKASGTVDLGTASAAFNDIYSVNAVTVTSDERKKEDIINSDLGLDFINKIIPVSYKLKDTTYEKEILDENNEPVLDENGDKTYETITIEHNRKHYGFTTQQIKSVLDDIGKSTNDFGAYVKEDINNIDSPESLRYTEFISPVVKAIQELSDKIDKLKIDNNLI